MKRALLVSAVLVSLAVPFNSSAAEITTELADFSYNYIEGGPAVYPGYGGRRGGGSQDFIGVRVGGTAEFTNEIFGYGQLRLLTDDVDFTSVSGGAAYRLPVPLPEPMDVYAGGGLEYWNVSNNGSADGLGLSVRSGVRYRINRDLEANGEARVVRIGGDIDETFIGIRGQILFDMAGPLSLLGEVDIEDGEVGLLGGFRAGF